jgi:LCP family protein required for cell wall assembly
MPGRHSGVPEGRTEGRAGRAAGRVSGGRVAGRVSGGRGAGPAATDGPRRRRSRRGLVAASIASALVLLASGCGWIALHTSRPRTFTADGISGKRPASGDGQNILLIGSDSRAGGNRALGGGSGGVGRSDTTLLLHVYSDQRHAVGVSIPRDALVDVPPCLLPDGTWSTPQHDVMFNSAFATGLTATGNPACTQNTVEQLTGLRVDHTVVVDFAGFAAMTAAVGGVQVCLPQDVYQQDLSPGRATRGALVFHQGLQTVSGQRALDYVRIRHGIGDGSDIGRMKRQQAFLASLFKKIKTEGFDPTVLLPLANAAVRSLTVDPGLGSAPALLKFAMSLKNIDLRNVRFVTAPWRYDGPRVALVQPAADRLWTALRANRPLPAATPAPGAAPTAPTASAAPSATATGRPGAGIDVAVDNATTVAGLAARAAGTLTADGFTVTRTGNAPGQAPTTTVIEYGAGEQAQAATVARLFPGAQVQPAPTAGLSAVRVVLGPDYAAAGAASAPPEDTSPPRAASDSPCSDLSYGGPSGTPAPAATTAAPTP